MIIMLRSPEIEAKTPSITDLANKCKINVKIRNVSDLPPKKTDYDTKYQTLRINLLSHLIMTSLWVK